MLTIISLIFLRFLTFNCSDINDVRKEYNEINSEDRLESFMKKIENTKCADFIPYRASATMMRAQYAFSPISKLNHFKKGKTALEEYIKKNPASVDARYVRIMIQATIPKFLNYSSDIKNDINFVKSNINKTDIPTEIKITILKNINNVKI